MMKEKDEVVASLALQVKSLQHNVSLNKITRAVDESAMKTQQSELRNSQKALKENLEFEGGRLTDAIANLRDKGDVWKPHPQA